MEVGGRGWAWRWGWGWVGVGGRVWVWRWGVGVGVGVGWGVGGRGWVWRWGVGLLTNCMGVLSHHSLSQVRHVEYRVPQDRSLSIRRSTTSPVRIRVATGFSTYLTPQCRCVEGAVVFRVPWTLRVS